MKPETRAANEEYFEKAAATAEVSTGKTRRQALCKALVYVQALNLADQMNGDPPKRKAAEDRIVAAIRAEGIVCPPRGERRNRL